MTDTPTEHAPATPDDLFARLTELGIETTTVTHPPVYTVEESQKLCSDIPGGHCKNLFLKDKKGAIWLIVTLEDADVDMKSLHRTIGSGRLSFGKPELLMEVLGVIPGAVTPFALINDTQVRVNVVLDRTMMTNDILNYHPLTNEATTAIPSHDLVTFIEACGHTPQVVDIDP